MPSSMVVDVHIVVYSQKINLDCGYLLDFQNISSIGIIFTHGPLGALTFCMPGREIYQQPHDICIQHHLDPYTASTMSLSCQSAARSCVRSFRSPSTLRISTSSLAQNRSPLSARRWTSTESASNPKIAGIVDQISQLTLLETADLIASLKVG